jgi:O-antigen ligase
VTIVVAAIGAGLLVTSLERPEVGVGVVLGVPGGALVGYLLLHRFEAFLSVMLFIRPLLDLTKGTHAGTLDLTVLTGIGMIAAMVWWLWFHRHPFGERQASPLTSALIAFAAVSLAAVLGSALPMTAFIEGSRLLSGVLLFLVCDTMLARGVPIRRLLASILAAAILPLLVPLIGPAVGIDAYHYKDGIRALRSTFFLSNNFAHFLAPFIVLGVALIGSVRGARRIFLLAILAIALTELVLAVTRGAWLAVLVGIFVIGLVHSRRILLVALSLSILAYAFVPAVHERVTNLAGDPGAPRNQSSLAWRIDHWSEIISLSKATPLIGIGPGMTLALSHNEKAPHSDYVRAYVETGVLGLLAYLFVIASMLYVGWRAVGRSEGAYHLAAVGVFAFSCGFAVASLAENLITSVSFLWFVMPMLAIVNRLAYPPQASGGLAWITVEPVAVLPSRP